MKFIGKVTGTNKAFESLIDMESDGELSWVRGKDYQLNFGDKTLYFEVYNFLIGGNDIELEGWAGDKDNNFGRIAIKIQPLIAK